MTEQQERVLQFSRTIGMSKSAFEESLGMSRGALARAKSLSEKMKDLLRQKYPMLNMDWVMSGIGNMYRDGIVIEQDFSSGKHVQSPHTEIHGDDVAMAALQAKCDALEEKVRSLEALNERLMKMLDKSIGK